MSDRNSADRGAPAAPGRAPSDRDGSGRQRPPGPEEQRGATATGRGSGQDDQPNMRGMVRTPRFWVTLLVLLAINWLLVPLLFPEPQDRVTVPYTFFKQQVAAGNDHCLDRDSVESSRSSVSGSVSVHTRASALSST